MNCNIELVTDEVKSRSFSRLNSKIGTLVFASIIGKAIKPIVEKTANIITNGDKPSIGARFISSNNADNPIIRAIVPA